MRTCHYYTYKSKKAGERKLLFLNSNLYNENFLPILLLHKIFEHKFPSKINHFGSYFLLRDVSFPEKFLCFEQKGRPGANLNKKIKYAAEDDFRRKQYFKSQI